MCRFIACLMSLLLGASTAATACSTFATQGSAGFVVGRNMDNELPVAGLVLINKRGIRKAALPWATLAPSSFAGPKLRWTSLYGSVTFTAIGREFPDGGMNEAGLVVEEMSLTRTSFPPSGNRATLSQTEWIQYQLDNFATVRDVLKHLDSVGISGWGWHFLIADASGDCASVEFIDGKPVTARNAGISGCVLTNDSLADSRTHLTRFQGFGGDERIPEARDSLSRYVRAADLIHRDPHTRPDDDVGFGFEILGAVDQGSATQRSIVYEVTARKLHFRTHDHRAVKTIDFSRLDFTKKSPTQMLDIESPLSSDVTAAFVNYTAKENRRVVESFVQLVHATDGAADVYHQDLQQAGLTEAQYVDVVVNHPDDRGYKKR